MDNGKIDVIIGGSIDGMAGFCEGVGRPIQVSFCILNGCTSRSQSDGRLICDMHADGHAHKSRQDKWTTWSSQSVV
jgi:hypothetical protein